MSKIVSFFKNKTAAVATAVVLATASVNAFAVEGAAGDVNLSSLTNNISFAGVITAVMAIAASIITLYAAMAGVRKVVQMVKSA